MSEKMISISQVKTATVEDAKRWTVTMRKDNIDDMM